MSVPVQIIAAFAGSLGFSLVFHVRKELIGYSAIGGLVCWGTYLLALKLNATDFAAAVVATMMITIYAEVFARITKTPATQYLITGLIPLVPGGSLYYFMSALIRQDWAEAKAYGSATAICVLGIAVGISVTLSIWAMIRHAWRLMKGTSQP